MRKVAAAVSAGVWSLVTYERRRQRRAPLRCREEKRLEWFREAKYGMFIHWGLYAIPAGEWKGQRCLGLGEWMMNRCKVPVRDYETAGDAVQPGRSSTPTTGSSSRRTRA